MLAYGINLKEKKKRNTELIQKELIGPHCPFCKMINVPGVQFCSSCKKPLSIISYDKIAKEAEQQKKTLESMLNRMRNYEDQSSMQVNMLVQAFSKMIAKSNPGFDSAKVIEELNRAVKDTSVYQRGYRGIYGELK